MKERLLLWRIRGTDWFRVEVVGSDVGHLLVRAHRVEGRAVVHSLVVTGDRVDPAALKAIPMSKIETELNRGSRAESIGELKTPYEENTKGDKLLNEVFVALMTDDRDTYADAEAETTEDGRPKLQRPDGSDPDAFYRKVAAAYEETVATTSKVAVVLAEEAGVPVPTVHRWVREARRRGFLPPARQGRAG